MGQETTAVAPAAQNQVQKPVQGQNMKVGAKGATRKECELITRLNDRSGNPETLYCIITQMAGGDKLFVDKFIQCCKSQVSKAWKKTATGWDNPFLQIPLNSQLDALYKCASRKILPDGYNANLVPYICRKDRTQSKVEVVIDYKGLIDCAIREGIIVDADAKEVCENDEFVWNLGEVERWTFDFRKSRGAVCGYCAWVVFANGRKKWYYMTCDEIAQVRECARATNIWDKWAGEMSKKTVIRRIFKTIRNSPNLTAMMEVDNDFYEVADGVEVDGATVRKHLKRSPVKQITGVAGALPAPNETPDQPEAEAPAEAEEVPPEAERVPVEAHQDEEPEAAHAVASEGSLF